MKYSFKPYKPEYKTFAKDEMARLRQVLPTAQIEHFGSTSIPGVGGKGIIDIYVAVTGDEIKNAFRHLEELGYEYKPSGGVENERLFFQQEKELEHGEQQWFHIHLTYKGNKNLQECLQFRDYLRLHPEDAKEYEKIKYEAVEAAQKQTLKADKKKAYMDTKQPVIQKIMAKMKQT